MVKPKTRKKKESIWCDHGTHNSNNIPCYTSNPTHPCHLIRSLPRSLPSWPPQMTNPRASSSVCHVVCLSALAPNGCTAIHAFPARGSRTFLCRTWFLGWAWWPQSHWVSPPVYSAAIHPALPLDVWERLGNGSSGKSWQLQFWMQYFRLFGKRINNKIIIINWYNSTQSTNGLEMKVCVKPYS